LQSARSNRGVVIKQGDTHESFACFLEMLALNLDVASQQSRFRIHPSLRLQTHDLLGDLLRVIGFVCRNFRGPKREQCFRLRGRVGRHLEVFFVGGFRLGKILQLRFRVCEIKPEIRLHVTEAFTLAEDGEIFLRGRVILLAVVLDSKPLEDFRRHPRAGIGREESVHFIRKSRAILEVEKGRKNPERGQVIILLLVQLARSLQRRQCSLVILSLKCSLADIFIVIIIIAIVYTTFISRAA